MTTSVPSLTDVDLLAWERLMAETRYGRYADEIESRLVSFALSKHSSRGVLLDIGCEGGRRSQLFADQGWEITALDTDGEALETCKQRVPDGHCILADPHDQKLAVGTQAFDVALCIEVGPVIHQQWAVGEFARVLRPGGRFVGVCWNRTSWRGFLYHHSPALRITGSNPLVGYPIRYSDFRNEMVKSGFAFEKEVGYAWGPFRRNSNSALMPVWMAFEKFSGLQRIVGLSPMVAFVCRKQ
jgi:SAM-dependent methyltransferase